MHLSPTAHHHHLIESTPPALSYAGGEVRHWQQTLRRKLRQLVGEMPTERVPLQVRTLWTRPHPLGTIEKIVFTSEPYAEVPAYVCLPREAQAPYPFFVCLQGHSTGMHNSIAVDRDTNLEPIVIEGDRDFGLGCMARGIAALCIEQRAFGERREADERGCHTAAMHALMLGRTLIGERVYDVDRGLDYLAARGDADMTRVGVMGNSGGGTVALFAAALLPRLRYAMPSCYFCTFRDSIMALFHCVCNYLPGVLRYAEMADIMGLFAPRPLVIVAGREDPIFPLPGVEAAYAHLQAIYQAAGAAERCHLVVGDGGHRFYAEEAWPVMLQELAQTRAGC